jgi:hypothetical protein
LANLLTIIVQVFFYLKCVTSREKFPGSELNLNRVLERAGQLIPAESSGPEELASVSLVQLIAVALG